MFPQRLWCFSSFQVYGNFAENAKMTGQACPIPSMSSNSAYRFVVSTLPPCPRYARLGFLLRISDGERSAHSRGRSPSGKGFCVMYRCTAVLEGEGIGGLRSSWRQQRRRRRGGAQACLVDDKQSRTRSIDDWGQFRGTMARRNRENSAVFPAPSDFAAYLIVVT